MRRQAILFISIVILLMGHALSANAQQTFCVYLNDGSVKFFNTADVDSITYSCIGLDGIEHEDCVVQEIYTPDIRHRIPLEQIDSVSFVMPKRDIETLKSVHEGVDKYFAVCATIDEMSKHLGEIEVMKGVADVWTTDDALYVRTNDGTTSLWLYPVDVQVDEYALSSAVKQLTRSVSSNTPASHEQLKPDSILIINQRSSDERTKPIIDYIEAMKKGFSNAGFNNVRDINQEKARVSFFQKNLTSYDIILLITHGSYDVKNKKHWILTGADYALIEKDNEKLKQFNDFNNRWPGAMSTGKVKEKRNGKYETVEYVMINENFIAENMRGTFNGSIIFNAACESLKGNNTLANAFRAKGAKTYLGYDEINYMGVYAGPVFFANMLLGMNVDLAFDKLEKEHPNFVHDHDATLKIIGNKDVCIIHPEVEATEPGEITSITVELNGKLSGWRNTLDREKSIVGFCWSSDPDPNMEEENIINLCGAYVSSYNISNDGTFTFTGKMKDLSPNTTYYYRPFLYMNNEFYYGDIKEVRTKKESIREYLVKLYNDTDGDNWKCNNNWLSDKPVTDWYGVGKSQDSGLYTIELPWNNLNGTIDLSGCTELDRLECNENQLTSLNVSGCTALEYLYCHQNQLTSLDVSGCKNLVWFYCHNNQLTSLDVSGCTALDDHFSFSGNQFTSLDVSGCTALTCLICNDYQLTSLNVSGCTALKKLECAGNQLTSLDVSSCTALGYLGCYKNQLTSLNVSGCTALITLWCERNKLTSLDVSSCTALNDLSCFENHISQQIPDYFKNLEYFYHDIKYVNYHYDDRSDTWTWDENEYGWWYPGEPESHHHW